MIFGLITIVIVIAIFFFGFAGILQLLGITVTSYWSLFIFVSVYFVFGFIFDLFVGGLVAYIANKLSGFKLFVVRLLVEGSFDYLALFIADELVTGITIPPLIKLFIVLLMFVITITFERKERRVE